MPQASAPLADLLPSWELSLQEANRNDRTIDSYLGIGRALLRYLAASGMPADTEDIDAPHIRAFIEAEIDRTSPLPSPPASPTEPCECSSSGSTGRARGWARTRWSGWTNPGLRGR